MCDKNCFCNFLQNHFFLIQQISFLSQLLFDKHYMVEINVKLVFKHLKKSIVEMMPDSYNL